MEMQGEIVSMTSLPCSWSCLGVQSSPSMLGYLDIAHILSSRLPRSGQFLLGEVS